VRFLVIFRVAIIGEGGERKRGRREEEKDRLDGSEGEKRKDD
jgi:hypothetical protein